jgi:hypothetical protein
MTRRERREADRAKKREADRNRRGESMCRCPLNDDVRVFYSEADSRRDKTKKTERICETCAKPRHVIRVLTQPGVSLETILRETRRYMERG